MKGGFQISNSAFTVIGLILILFFLAHRACIDTRTVETFEPDGQVYRPSGASEGYPAGIRIHSDELQIEFDGYDQLYGINIDSIESDPSTHETAIYIGEGWDCVIETEEHGCIFMDEKGYLMFQYPEGRK